MTYPAASSDIDPVDRLTILAAALPGAAVAMRRIAASFDAVWQVIADLEHATPRYEPGVARVRVTERHGEFLRLLVQDTAGREDAMEARLRPGWCVMQSGTIVIAFAALRHVIEFRADECVIAQTADDVSAFNVVVAFVTCIHHAIG